MRTLGELLQKYDQPWASVVVPDFAVHSDLVKRGDVFVALAPEPKAIEHISHAVGQGAGAVLYDPERMNPANAGAQKGVPVVAVPSLKYRIADMASDLWGNPSDALRLYGVTGTNGKSTVAHYIARLSTAVGTPVGVGGTLGVRLPQADVGDFSPDFAGYTTPPTTILQKTLARLLKEKCAGAVLEVSSHALEQNRTQGLNFDCAVFVNLSRDHLDYHRDMLGYCDAKSRLFATPELRMGVVNADDKYSPEMVRVLPPSAQLVRYGRSDNADLKLQKIHSRKGGGYQIQVNWRGQEGVVEVPVLGQFNVINLLAAMAAVLGWGEHSLDDLLPHCAQLDSLPGRMQRVGGDDKPLVLVDYAHTPDALRAALTAAREHCEGGLGCVFGCGGERDVGKRALMAAVAAEAADWLVVTDDNPRGEDAKRIVEDILQGLPESGCDVQVCHQRAEAINIAVRRSLDSGDALLIAGKGHEILQEISGKKHSCNDVAIASQALDSA